MPSENSKPKRKIAVKKKTMAELYPNLPSLPDTPDRPRYRPHADAVGQLRPRLSVNFVTVDKEILGGTPCFSGTRVPVSLLFANLADGQSLEEILKSYPTLPRAIAIQALQEAGRVFADGYKDNPE